MDEYERHQKDLRDQIVHLVYYNRVTREEAWSLSATERKEMFEFTRARLKGNSGSSEELGSS